MLLLPNNDNQRDRRQFDCDGCSYTSGIMNELIMHKNIKHNCLNVSVIENAVDDILGLTSGKRKWQYCNQTKVKRLKQTFILNYVALKKIGKSSHYKIEVVN